MFDVVFQEVDSLPPLSWCMILERSLKGTVHHGRFVETFNNGFFEGGWDGPVELMEFDKSHFFLGSGARFNEEAVLISSPGHVLERIYSTKINEAIYFSNSLPFIIACSGQSLSDSYYNYESDFASILNGLDSYVRCIPTDLGEICLHYMTNLVVNGELNVEEFEKPAPPVFLNFKDYDDKLSAYLESLKENLLSNNRNHTFDFCTTISNGYDAAACSVKAFDVGCEISCSFNSPEKYKEDDGREVSKVLGFEKVVYRNANEYLDRDDLVEAEFVSSGELGTGIVFSSFEDLWKKKAVFMGERGDKIWEKNWRDVNEKMRVGGEVFAGTSMIEHRLRVGYILIPLPLFAALSWPSISKISNSEEMKEFSLGEGYDRPIPRRIIESKGVPRHVFGVKKIGAGFNYRYDNSARLKSRMSHRSFSDFQRFIFLHGKSKASFSKCLAVLLFYYSNKFLYARKALEKLKVSKVVVKCIPVDKKTLVSNPGISNDLIRWGVYTISKRYFKSIKGDDKGRSQ